MDQPRPGQYESNSNLETLEEELSSIVERSRGEVERFARDNPHAALGLAALAGFVLGGGLTPRRLLRIAFAVGGPWMSRRWIEQAAGVFVRPL